MKISDIIKQQERTLSLEVFPPKTTERYESVQKSVMEIAALKPDFMSVTYGAGGGTSMFTAKLAKEVKDVYGVTVMAHLSCISSSKEMVKEQLNSIKALGLSNILALRGDIPEGFSTEELDYHYANELVKEIKQFDDFCVGGACYPEGHPESGSLTEDIEHLKYKIEAGCEFLTTQMFFDNSLFYKYLEMIGNAGITIPIIAGIMPITNENQVERTLKLSGAFLPKQFIHLLESYSGNAGDFYKAGLDYAVKQVRDLYEHGVKNVHIYTMNKLEVARTIQQAVE